MTAPITLQRPDPAEYSGGFANYVHLPPDGDLLVFLHSQLADAMALLRGVSEEDSFVKHAPYAWSIKQVVGHISDCERVFTHRALWIARCEPSPLDSFDENRFMRFADFDRWPFQDLAAEFEWVRRANLILFRHFTPETWLRRGTVNQSSTSVRAMAYVIAGHAKHHLDILHRRLQPR